MIGVISRPDQVGVVEEFFELFKTPWEFYNPGQAYDVLVATSDQIPEVNPKLLVLYGPAAKGFDARFGIEACVLYQGALLRSEDTALPIYGQLQTFPSCGAVVYRLDANSEVAGFSVAPSREGEPHEFTMVRLGFDLFEEVRHLLSAGQAVQFAHIPALDVHIRALRRWILDAGIPLMEIPPVPAGYSLAVCLTHDIDFVGIRRHQLDHTMWGFVYRATAGAIGNFFRGRCSFARLVRSWLAVASLPFVYAGWVRDFWEPFEWYLAVERGLPATYFLIPFKGRPGDKVPGKRASRRATAYDVDDITNWMATLRQQGCELGLHGIDAWHSVEKGRDELARLAPFGDATGVGVRMHWLLRDANTPSTLERAGYAYDSTFGYNETVGYRAGTTQVFRPLGSQTLLELPLHIQDGALFYPQRLDLSQSEAARTCQTLLQNAVTFGGVLTLLWHDRSHGPERFWGHFYVSFLEKLRSLDSWFGTAAQVVSWFRARRDVHFEPKASSSGARTCVRYEGGEIHPPIAVRFYQPHRPSAAVDSVRSAPVEFSEIAWDGKSAEDLDLAIASKLAGTSPDVSLCHRS